MIMPHFNLSNFNLISHDQILKFVIKFVAVTSAGREWLMKLAGLGFQICTLSFFTASFNLQCTNQPTNEPRTRTTIAPELCYIVHFPRTPYSAQAYYTKC